MSVRRWLAMAILIVALGTAVAEAFDSWDGGLPAGQETESNVTAVALTIGLALSVAGTIIARSLVAPTLVRHHVPHTRVVRSRVALCVPDSTISRPLPLRI